MVGSYGIYAPNWGTTILYGHDYIHLDSIASYTASIATGMIGHMVMVFCLSKKI